jgi:hypothetical protein
MRGNPPDWKARAIAATRGTRFGAILACAMDIERDATPRFVGKAAVTSDGFVMCSFVDRDGNGHLGAFVGAASDLDSNVDGLARHLRLTDADSRALAALVAGWIATDYRARRA